MRIVQISDTHLSPDKPHFVRNWAQNEPALAGGVRVIVHAFLARAGSRA
jgi:hypothetical protein